MTGGMTRRGMLATAGGAALVSPAAPAGASPTRLAAPLPAAELDAELIEACSSHIAALDAYDRHGGRLEPEEDPLWHAVEATEATMDKAEPVTLAGLRALAEVARHRAEKPGADWSDGFTGDLPARVCMAALALLPASPAAGRREPVA